MQSRKDSILEATANIIFGYLDRLLIIVLVLPLIGVYIEFATNMLVAGIFTLESFVRSYYIRRKFTVISHNKRKARKRKKKINE